MSDMEHNKGKLIPVSYKEIEKAIPPLEGEDRYDHMDRIYDGSFVNLGDKLYRVEWEIKRGELYDFAYVDKNEDGSINFNTWHYNGSAHWTEVVEGALNE